MKISSSTSTIGELNDENNCVKTVKTVKVLKVEQTLKLDVVKNCKVAAGKVVWNAHKS